MRFIHLTALFFVILSINNCGSKKTSIETTPLQTSDSLSMIAESFISRGELKIADSLISKAREIYPKGDCKARTLRIEFHKIDQEKANHEILASLSEADFKDLLAHKLTRNYLSNFYLDSLLKETIYENRNLRKRLLRDRQIEEAKKIAVEQSAAADNRNRYGKTLRESYLDQSLDIKVSVYGKNNTTIKLTFSLFNDVWSHKMQKGTLIGEIQKFGFKKLILTDGFDYTVYWDF